MDAAIIFTAIIVGALIIGAFIMMSRRGTNGTDEDSPQSHYASPKKKPMPSPNSSQHVPTSTRQTYNSERLVSSRFTTPSLQRTLTMNDLCTNASPKNSTLV